MSGKEKRKKKEKKRKRKERREEKRRQGERRKGEKKGKRKRGVEKRANKKILKAFTFVISGCHQIFVTRYSRLFWRKRSKVKR